MRNTFIREKKIYCGDNYLEVDIYSYTMTQVRKKKRSKRKKESLIFQKNLNDKNARRKFLQIAETNFTDKDLHVSLTYNENNYPSTIEEAERDVQNFLRKVRRARAKKGLEKVKYMIVTQYAEDENGELSTRPHHHLLLNHGLDRDELENMWRRKRKKGEKVGEKIGIANADRLQPSHNTGLEQISSYICRHKNKKRKYNCSKNLKRPESRINDSKYSYRKLYNLATRKLDKEQIERMYPGYAIVDKDGGFEAVYNELTGWSVYLKMRRKEERRPRE